MAPNYIIILICVAFSLLCAILKQLYNSHYYPKNFYVFIIDVLLSTVSGIVLALILAERITNAFTLIGLSGLGGMFGLSGLKAIMKLNLGKKVRIQIGFDEEKQEDSQKQKKENKPQ